MLCFTGSHSILPSQPVIRTTARTRTRTRITTLTLTLTLALAPRPVAKTANKQRIDQLEAPHLGNDGFYWLCVRRRLVFSCDSKNMSSCKRCAPKSDSLRVHLTLNTRASDQVQGSFKVFDVPLPRQTCPTCPTSGEGISGKVTQKIDGVVPSSHQTF